MIPLTPPAITTPELTSVLTCPVCQHAQAEQMPTDACQWFYECTSCHTVLKPLAGDCCVFCSYGSVPCPPMQAEGPGGCCAQGAPTTCPARAQ